jgi:hypothetical protein
MKTKVDIQLIFHALSVYLSNYLYEGPILYPLKYSISILPLPSLNEITTSPPHPQQILALLPPSQHLPSTLSAHLQSMAFPRPSSSPQFVTPEFRIRPPRPGELSIIIPIFCEVMQIPSMRHDYDLPIFPFLIVFFREIEEKYASVSSSCFDGVGSWAPAPGIGVPSLMHKR